MKCPETQIYRHKVDHWLPGAGDNNGDALQMHWENFLKWYVLKLDYGDGLHNSVNLLKITELYT